MSILSTGAQVGIRHQAWWWVAEDGAPPVVPGFVHSSFNPLVAAVADRCLGEHYGKPPEPPSDRGRTGLVLVTRGGDRASAEHVRQTVAGGGRLGPLFFFQSVPNSILGYLAARWGLGGPVLCISPTGSPVADGIAEAAVLMSDGDADEVLLIVAEQAGSEGDDGTDCAHALLLGRPAEPAPAGDRVQYPEGRTA
ncbi:MAG TPA: beta-ketoacyl synthase chain length factor [Jatrophihabitans sp.]|nr:beta-ketoacyl synthase chain length factor [Jatrophihabitans sp.]